MRTDESSFRLDAKAKQASSAFTFDMGRFHTPATRAAMGSSQSGHERDRLFLNDPRADGSEYFADISGVSGLDSETDGRSFVTLDYDRDGWLDVAEVSANRPWLQLFRNRIAPLLGEDARDRRFLALRLVGGNRTAEPTREWSTRDAFGARIELDLGDETLLRTTASNRGLAAQNSNTLLIGLGDHPVVARLTVHWPSGRTSSFENLAAGLLYRIHEDPAASASGTGLELESYLAPVRAGGTPVAGEPGDAPTLDLLRARGLAPARGVVMYVGMQTECVACIQELPDVARLARVVGEDLTVVGVPVARYGWGPDARADDPEALAAFVERFQPAYDLLEDLTEDEVRAYTRLVEDELDQAVYSTVVLTDASGRVLRVRPGVPTLSELRQWLDTTRRRDP